VQKEVADRILAGPRTRDFGYFTLVMEYHFERAAGFQVPPGAFSPRPKVTSFVLKLTPRDTNPSVADYGRFRSILKQAFLHRRKTLWKNLKAQGYSEGVLESAWREIGIAPQARPEEVSLSEYVRLTGVL
jgi:16S rRNA (adenine1518-N6/adenine1519-N6)-dimethyltransferase